jgi:hypothetical protein
MKCAALERGSTTVRMTDLLLTLGSPSMKSMATSLHINDGTGIGCKRPDDRRWDVLLRWQTEQSRTNACTKALSPGI